MGAAAFIGAGAGLMAGGNATNAIGTAQANRRQRQVNDDERMFQEDLDRQAAARLEQLLQQESADKRLSDTATTTAQEAGALREVSDTVIKARGDVTATGSEGAQGELTRSLEGVSAGAGKRADIMARLRAQRIQQEETRKRNAEYVNDRSRLGGKSRSRQRLYPMLMHAASMRGAETRAAGQATTALGALLLQYGMNAGGTATKGGTPASTTAVTEAPLGGWATQTPGLA